MSIIVNDNGNVTGLPGWTKPIEYAATLRSLLEDWLTSFGDSIEGGEADELVMATRAALATPQGRSQSGAVPPLAQRLAECEAALACSVQPIVVHRVVQALRGAEKWLEGWASAEPWLSHIREALALYDAALAAGSLPASSGEKA